MRFIVPSVDEIKQVGNALRANKEWPIQVIIEEVKKDRNLAQNSLIAKLYTEIGKQSGNGFAYERGFYKFNLGCPILVRDSQDFAEFYNTLLDLYEYEEMIKVMSTNIISVSSLMNIKQASEYIDNIYQSAHERGIYLSKEEDIYIQAMNR